MATEQGVAIRQSAGDLRKISRNTQGVRMIRLDENDVVRAVCKVAEREDEEDESDGTE